MRFRRMRKREAIIFKVPDGTKTVLKELAVKRGFLCLSELLRDLVRRELLKRREQRS